MAHRWRSTRLHVADVPLGVADDVAYGAGVMSGAIQSRSLGALKPHITKSTLGLRNVLGLKPGASNLSLDRWADVRAPRSPFARSQPTTAASIGMPNRMRQRSRIGTWVSAEMPPFNELLRSQPIIALEPPMTPRSAPRNPSVPAVTAVKVRPQLEAPVADSVRSSLEVSLRTSPTDMARTPRAMRMPKSVAQLTIVDPEGMSFLDSTWELRRRRRQFSAADLGGAEALTAHHQPVARSRSDVVLLHRVLRDDGLGAEGAAGQAPAPESTNVRPFPRSARVHRLLCVGSVAQVEARDAGETGT